MKKLIKRILPFALVVVMCLCMAAPAFADSSWVGVFQDFPGRYWGGPNDGYVRMIQSSMWAYGGSSRTYISNAGGTDGAYGEKTYYAVRDFQAANDLNPDGGVGYETWGTIAELTSVSGSGSTYTFLLNGYYCLRAVVGATTSSTWYYYQRGSGSGFATAVTHYS